MEPSVVAQRSAVENNVNALRAQGIHPLLARLWSARGVQQSPPSQWADMLAPKRLAQVEPAATILADAIGAQQKLLVVADYDCDGATACALAVRLLRQFGAQVDFLVPNRFATGYGLTPAVVELACQHPAGKPDIIITVDNGIASNAGVAAANAVGIKVIITDHHLPGEQLPQALAIVNPNQAQCQFPSKHLAGVGVVFYLMLALRTVLRARGQLPDTGGPQIQAVADLLALGTVADVVRLDANNRLLVTQGLKRIRAGKMQPGIAALFEIAKRDYRQATVEDLGFALGPRINAAGRMADMSLGIHCLLADEPDEARQLAQALDAINQQRRTLESDMQSQALALMPSRQDSNKFSICVWQEDWHQGVVGLLAARLKDAYWLPSIAFAPTEDGILRGSGRSIPNVHLRDVIDLVSKRLPGAILQFGGHAMAAGLSLQAKAFDDFANHFDAAVKTLAGDADFARKISTDGSLELEYFDTATADMLAQQVWGAGFPAPVFYDEFTVLHQQVLKDKHLKLFLQRADLRLDAIWFNQNASLPRQIKAAYRINNNTWGARSKLQLLIEHAHPVA